MNVLYNDVLNLISKTTQDIAELNDLLRTKPEQEFSEQEKKDIQFALLKLTIAIKEFGK
jgi:hypothetical protein